MSLAAGAGEGLNLPRGSCNSYAAIVSIEDYAAIVNSEDYAAIVNSEDYAGYS